MAHKRPHDELYGSAFVAGLSKIVENLNCGGSVIYECPIYDFHK